MNEYEKLYQKLAFVFAHDIKTFEGYVKLSGFAPRASYAFLCFDIMVKHSCAFLIHNFSTVNTEMGRPMLWKPLCLLSTSEVLAIPQTINVHRLLKFSTQK